MFPLALLLKKNGFSVSGSDQKKNPNLKILEELGSTLFTEHSEKNIIDADFIVYSTAIKEDNPERKEAKKTNKKQLHRSDLLKALINTRKSITISGTHGKTTTTALVESVLNKENENNSISLLGGTSLALRKNDKLEECTFLIAEADESDGSFIKYQPDIAVITNIEKDHLDFFGSFKNIEDHFSKHLSNLKGKKIVIYNREDPVVRKLVKQSQLKEKSFGFSKEADIWASEIQAKENITFFKIKEGEKEKPINLPLLGKHNVLNALAAWGVSSSLAQSRELAVKGLEDFKGVKKRLELIYKKNNFLLYDDYAHNPGKIKACLKALKEHFPEHTLIALFEPHRYSRIRNQESDFLDAFHPADLVLVFPTFSAGEKKTKKDLSQSELARKIKERCHNNAEGVYNVEEGFKSLMQGASQKTVTVALGAGDISHYAYKIREKIKCENSLSNEIF